MFNHVNIDLPSLNKETIDGVRYYDVPGNAKLVSITSITSWINREIFREWRARVGNEQADKVTKAATSRGTDMHTLTEYYLKNENLPEVQPLSEFLFKQSKPKPRKWIDHYFVQCAAYACMLYELTNIPVKKFVILMSCENGECVVYEEYNKKKYIKLLSEYIREFVTFKLQEYGKS